MAETIIKTRITPKKLTENIISRERLLKKIGDSSEKNLILVLSPAGYGKTTLVLDYLKSTGKPYAWLYVSTDVDSFKSYISYVIHSLKHLKAEFGEKTLELVNSLSQSDLFSKDETGSVNSVMDSFVNEFSEIFDDDVWLVIDDLHNIGEAAWLNSSFNSLIENFPQNLHIIITSRLAPGFNLARLKAKRNLLKIESKDLTFNAAETEKLLSDIYSISYAKDDLSLLNNKIEGWITGLHLILQAYGEDFSKISASDKIVDESIFDYFAEDIFNNLEPGIQDFMLSTSLLDSFSPEMCDKIFGLTGSSEMIESLVGKNLFIDSTIPGKDVEDSDAGAIYSYHNLFRQFLNKRLSETKSESEIASLAEKIFGYFESEGDVISTIEFTFKANNYKKASELICGNFDNLFMNGRYELLWRWFEQFPAEIVNSEPEILFLKGKLMRFYKNDPEKSSAIFSEVISKTSSDDTLNILASLELFEILKVTGKPEEALKLVKALYTIKKEPALQIKVIISFAVGYYRLGSKHYDEAIKLLEEAESIAEGIDAEQFTQDIYSLYGKIYLNKGEFIKSLHYFENRLRKETNIYRRFQTINDIVLLHSWSGEYEKAKKYLDESIAIYQRFKIPLFERDVLKLTALLKFEVGDYEDAIEKISELSAIDKRNNFTSFVLMYNLLMYESFMLMNKIDKAGEYISLADKVRDPKDEYLQLEFQYHAANLSKLKSINSAMEKTFLATLKFYDAHNLVYNAVQVKLHLADYYFKKGNPDTSIKYLSECLNTASERQYNSFLAQHFLQMRYLFDFAVSKNIQKNYIRSIFDKVVERNSYVWLSAECKKRLLTESQKLADIRLETFGGVRLLVRGNEIPEDKWLRKKSKLLLIYLLINQGMRIQKDKVLGMFFSELSASSAENVFHQSITNIRNVLKPAVITNFPADPKSKKKRSKDPADSEAAIQPIDVSPAYIVYEDKILGMASGFDYYTDVNEFNLLYGIVKSPESSGELKESGAKKAIDLYKGEFLPGHYDEWIEELRSILEHKYTEVCEELIDILIAKKKFDEAAGYSEKLIIADSLHENAYLSAIRAYTEINNKNMARKKFSQLLKKYDEEYGEKPSKSVMDEISTILSEK